MYQTSAGAVHRNRYYITQKLEKVGASSIKTAVTPDEAKLTYPEREWLMYLTGGMTSKIRKTEDHRYYLRNPTS